MSTPAKTAPATPTAPAEPKLAPGMKAGRFTVSVVPLTETSTDAEIEEYVSALDASFKNDSASLEIACKNEAEVENELKKIRAAAKMRPKYSIRTKRVKPAKDGGEWTVKFLAKARTEK